MSNIGFKNSSLLVNANLVGLRQRTGVLARSYAAGNYALRSDWGCADGLRAVLGKYFAVSATTTGQDFVNFASDKLTAPSLRNQVKDIPLILTEIPSTNDNIGPKSAKFLIELDNTAWNNLNFVPGLQTDEPTVDFLRQNIDEEGVEEGDPYWRWYLKKGIPATAAPTNYTKWLFPMPPVINTQGTFFDHTTLYYSPSSNKAIRAESGTNIKVEPVYNYYADTTPPYEQISQVASEPMLTNFYCLESEMRNTSPTLNSPDYFAQITLNSSLQNVNIDNDLQPDPWFQQVEGQEGTMTESKTVQLYTLYSKGLNILNTDDPGLPILKGIFNTSYKNIVILNSDLEAMNDLAVRDDESSGLKNLPFYNKITIGYDAEGVGDYSEISDAQGGSWLGELRTDLNNELGGDQGLHGAGSQLIDILQLYIIQNIEGFGSPGTSQTFTKRSVEKFSDQDPTNLATSVASQNVSFVFNMDNFLKDIVFHGAPGSTAPTRVEQIIERINTNQTTGDNFILIRNYNQNVVEMDNEAIRAFLLLEEDGRINYPTRTIQEIVLQNKLAANETLMYKIDKRVITPDGTASDPVQTFYIGRSFDGRDINYIDSQVKYGVRYRYDISEIKIVFGSKYSYANLNLHYTTDVGRQNGRATANALGFYRPVRSDILLDDIVEERVKEYTPADEDVPSSAVGIEGGDDTMSSLTGYYIFKPTNRVEIDAMAFSNLFDEGTHWARAGSRGTAAGTKLAKINIQVKEGFGLGGNENGGAIGATLDLPIVATVTAPRPKGRSLRPRNIGIRAPLRGTGASAQFGVRHRRPRSTPRSRRPGSLRGPRIGTRMNRPGGVTPPLTPNFLHNLFGIP